ncbi:MAG: VacJ family lipoprotein [Pseudohongiellaceae bacterium]
MPTGSGYPAWPLSRALRQRSLAASLVVSIVFPTLPGTAPLAADDPGDTDIDPTVVSYRVDDPLIRINRAVFRFNDFTYRYALIPVSNAYHTVVPEPVDRSLGNAFYNVKMPIYAVNNLLQGKPRDSGTNALRFLINFTIGIGGFFDPAAAWFELERKSSGFDESLESFGVGNGVFIVLPLLGPTDTRGAAGTFGDYLLNPLAQLIDNPESILIRSLDYLQGYSNTAAQYEVLREQSVDPYLFFRDLYLQGQQRDAEFP